MRARIMTFVLLMLAGCEAELVLDTDAAPRSDSGRSSVIADAAQLADRVVLGTDAMPPAHHVGECNALAAPGVWENITPPDVVPQLPGPGDCTYGVGSFAVDPADSGTLILGTCEMGMWKSTDCGASWTRLNTGRNGGALDNGRQWTLAVDEITGAMFTNSGYNGYIDHADWDNNGVSGAFRSVNGGVDWEAIWPPPADESLHGIVGYDFVSGIEIDPYDHNHLLMSFHASCGVPYNTVCIAESHDSGSSWRLVNGDPTWSGGEGQGVWFLDASDSWLWGSQTNGLWRTNDAGASWTLVDATAQGHAAGQMHRSADGTFYLAANGVLRSPNGTDWTLAAPAAEGPIAGIASDGTTMYISSGFPWGADHSLYQPFFTSPEGDGATWTPMASPDLGNGGPLIYDPDHHILYSSNEFAGLWRVVLE